MIPFIRILLLAGCFSLFMLLYQIQYRKKLLLSFISSTTLCLFVYLILIRNVPNDVHLTELPYLWAIAAVSFFLTIYQQSDERTKYKVDEKTAFFLKNRKGEKLFFGYPQDNFLVYGGAGSGKTKSIGKPIMEQFIANKYAGFIYDFKDFDYTKTAYNLVKKYDYEKPDSDGVERKFYHVSFTDLNKTHRFNPLKRFKQVKIVDSETGCMSVKEEELISQTMMQQLMNDFLRAFLPPSAKEDEWFSGALGILQGVAYRFWDEYRGFCTLPHICLLIMVADNDKLTKFLNGSSTAATLAGAYVSAAGSEKTQASYVSSLKNYISIFATNKEVAYVLTGDDLDFDLVDPKKPKLFAVSNNYAINAILSPVISMLFSISSRKFSFANKQNFVYVLDEMTTFKVRDFEMLPSTLREFGVAFVLLTQSGAKLEKLYNKLDRSSIEANFANMFLGRTKDVEALKYYPQFFGKHEVTKKSKTKGNSSGGSSNSVTINTQKEEVYEAKAFTALEPGEFIGSAGHTNKPEFHEKFAQYAFTWKGESKEMDIEDIENVTRERILQNYISIHKDINVILSDSVD